MALCYNTLEHLLELPEARDFRVWEQVLLGQLALGLNTSPHGSKFDVEEVLPE